MSDNNPQPPNSLPQDLDVEKIKRNVIYNVITTEPVRIDPVQIVAQRCGAGHHRWAYLEAGGQACGYCGVRRR